VDAVGTPFTTIASVPVVINSNSRSTVTGMVGGIDFTARGLLSPDDGLIFGPIGGYVFGNTRITSTVNSTNSALVGNGSSVVNATSSGPSTGAFATYFSGPFSMDVMYKVDLLSMRENFVDNQAYGAGIDLFGGSFNVLAPSFATITGSGTTSLRAHNLVGNLNYRFSVTQQVWVEPTLGTQVQWSDYDSSASLLGLKNGRTVRVQLGSRIGFDTEYNGIRFTPILTGLAYNDVDVRGGFVPFTDTGAFAASAVPLSGTGASVLGIRQQGLWRGVAAATLIADFGNGFSSFIQADVRGGQNLFGAGGRGGLRYQW
jgi:hypothetical protein